MPCFRMLRIRNKIAVIRQKALAQFQFGQNSSRLDWNQVGLRWSRRVSGSYRVVDGREAEVGSLKPIGGETGIRTLGAREGTTVFETAPFDRSGTSPC